MTRKKLPVLKWLAPCPDCCAEWVDRGLRHEPSCPLGNAVEDVCEDDRRYFAERPNALPRIRPIAPAELEQLRHMDPPTAAAATQVVVHNCRDGRLRSFVDDDGLPLGIMLDFNDEGAA